MSPKSPILTTIGFEGLQVVFSLISGQAVSHLSFLGLNSTQISLTLLSGPICGAVIQPYFGSWSDRCQNPWGKRRPFIVIGTVVTISSMLLLAWTEAIATGLNDLLLSSNSPRGSDQEVTSTAGYTTLAVVLAMLFTFGMYAAIQAVQVGLRALITDACTPLRQATVNAWAGRHMNLAAALSYLVTFMQPPLGDLYVGPPGKTTFATTSLLTAMYMIITISITYFLVPERSGRYYPLESHTSYRPATKWLAIRDLLIGQSASRQIRLICLVQFFAWLGWYPFLFYTATYVNTLRKPETMASTDFGSLTLLVHSTMALVVAIILPHQDHLSCITDKKYKPEMVYSIPHMILTKANSYTTPRKLWIVSHGIFAAAMLGTFLVTSAPGTIFLSNFVGFSWAVTTRVPYSFLAEELSMARMERDDIHGAGGNDQFSLADHQGLIWGIHNLAICLAQILDLSLMGFFWMLASHHRNESVVVAEHSEDFVGVVWFLRLGGLFALVAMYFACKVPPSRHSKHEVGDSYYLGIPLEEDTRTRETEDTI